VKHLGDLSVEVFTAMTIKNMVLWLVTPYNILTDESIASQRLGDSCYRNNESRLRDNGKTQLFDEVISSRHEKNYLKRVTGRLQTRKKGRSKK
jgi:hypothetical protein